MIYREIDVDSPDYLHLRCSGVWEMESSKRVWQHIVARLGQLDHGKVLLDEREVELETSVSIDFGQASFVADLARGVCRKAAIVDNTENSESDHFFETVCVNRSLNLKFFLSEHDAIEWLLD
ncbi:MAG: hypothetical protein GY802_25215 [Gammaproteobacteria bacterium]|nr:hypothetical protein [Gammaproteobacteria bacterium]